MARIYRDAFGVPHVRATSSTTSRTARDGSPRGTGPGSWSSCAAARPAPPPRSSDPPACRGTGSPAAPGSPTPRAARTTACRRRRARSWRRTSTGVNDGLHADAPELEALGIEPAQWEEWTPLAVFHAQHLLFASLPGKLWSARAREVLGDDAELLSHEGPLAERQQRVGGRRRPDGERLPARSAATRTARSRARASTSRSGWRATSSTSSGFAFPGVPGHPALRARRRRRLGDHQRDGRLPGRVRRAAAARGRRGARRSGRTAGSRRRRGSRRSRCSAHDAERGRDRDHGPRAGVLRERRRGRRAQPARRVVGAGRPRLRRDPPAAARPHRRRRRRGASTRGWSRSTTS